MAKDATAKQKKPAFSKEDFQKANKKQLRAWCDEYGIKWSKLTDDEAALRKKLQGFVVKLAAAEEDDSDESETSDVLPFDGKRAPKDPKTGRPLDCFGWYYSAEASQCTKSCPHRDACKPLSIKAAALATEVEDDLEAEEEAESVTEDDAETVRKGHVKKASKKKPEPEEDDEEEQEEPEEEEEETEEDDEVAEDDEESPPKKKEKTATITSRVGAIGPDTIVIVAYDESAISEMDFSESPGLEDFYKRVLKVAQKTPKKLVKGSLIKKIAFDALKLDEGKESEAIFRDLVRVMVEGKEFILRK